jgi:hypothetical protein
VDEAASWSTGNKRRWHFIPPNAGCAKSGSSLLSERLPVGVGALSWITLQLEIRGWERFQNRRQIASYTGLCFLMRQLAGLR